MAGPTPTPHAHVPCPNCGQPVLANAPMCPNCGAYLRDGRPTAGKNTGLWVLLIGLGLCVLAGGVFFFGYLSSINWSTPSGGGSSSSPWWLTLSELLGVVGAVAMLAGFVMALIQAFRR